MKTKKKKKNYEELARRRRLSGIGGKSDLKKTGFDTAKGLVVAVVAGAAGSALGNFGLAAGLVGIAAGSHFGQPEVVLGSAAMIAGGVATAAAGKNSAAAAKGGFEAAKSFAIDGMKAGLFLPEGGAAPAAGTPANGLGRVPNRSYMNVPRNIEQLYGDDRVLTLPLPAAAQANDIINRNAMITAQPVDVAAQAGLSGTKRRKSSWLKSADF
jgi:hypothetical protein